MNETRTAVKTRRASYVVAIAAAAALVMQGAEPAAAAWGRAAAAAGRSAALPSFITLPALSAVAGIPGVSLPHAAPAPVLSLARPALPAAAPAAAPEPPRTAESPRPEPAVFAAQPALTRRFNAAVEETGRLAEALPEASAGQSWAAGGGLINALKNLVGGREADAPVVPVAPEARPSPRRTAPTSPAVPDQVAIHKKVARLEALARNDPEQALAEIRALLLDEGDSRPEMRLAAARALEGLEHPGVAAEAAAVLGRRVPAEPKAAAMPEPDLRLLLGRDAWAPVRRIAARTLGARAAEAGAARAAAAEALEKAYHEDPNPSVRLMAGWALAQYGPAPGESRFEAARAKLPAVGSPEASAAAAARPAVPEKPWYKQKYYWFTGAIFAIGIIFSLNPPGDNSYRAPTAAMEQTAAPRPATALELKERQDLRALSSQELAVEQVLEERAQTDIGRRRLELEKERLSEIQGSREDQTPPSLKTYVMPVVKFLGSALMMLLPVAFIFWLFMRMQQGGLGGPFGKFKKAQMTAERPLTRFSDVAGIDAQLREVREIADYLREPARFAKMGGRVPRGVLLEGPPGTGKTLMARALAGESGAAFFSVSGSDFIQMYVGLGASRVRELFENARKERPAVIFIDEIDAVGAARSEGPGNPGSREHDQTLNSLLTEMDGFEADSGIIVVAATNRADKLDAALLRPGRFDRRVFVSKPDLRGRDAILAIHARPVRLHPEVELLDLARRTSGMAGAGLANVVNEAALLAARKGLPFVTMAELHEGVDRTVVGQKRDVPVGRDELERVALHEAGHVIAQRFTPTGRIPNKVTITPHGPALGFAEPGGDEDRFLHNRQELKDMLVAAVAAMRAESEAYGGNTSSGSSNDLEKANSVARAMVTQFGMGAKTGLLSQPDRGPYAGRSVSEATAREIDLEVKALLDWAWDEARRLLTLHGAAHKALSAALLAEETLERDRIEEVIVAAEAAGRTVGER